MHRVSAKFEAQDKIGQFPVNNKKKNNQKTTKKISKSMT